MSGSKHIKHTPSDRLIDDFIRAHKLPPAYRSLALDYFLPLASWLTERRESGSMMLGINGAQGTGKSTLADFLQCVLESQHAWRIAVLSIDDFYLTKRQRSDLAASVHPLLAVRGVPGTHDVSMLRQCLDEVKGLRPGEQRALPRFDKAADDRADPSGWPVVDGPVHLIILEGWCVGSAPQDDDALAASVNDLERKRDPNAEWRTYVNDCLKSDYCRLFAELDALVFLKAPSFEAIHRWRAEQEQKLAATAPAGAAGIMNEDQIAEFIQYYERITRDNLARLPDSADVVFELGEDHSCIASHYRGRR